MLCLFDNGTLTLKGQSSQPLLYMQIVFKFFLATATFYQLTSLVLLRNHMNYFEKKNIKIICCQKDASKILEFRGQSSFIQKSVYLFAFL